MAGRRVIGLDAGGTKLLGGVVEAGGDVLARVRRFWRGEDTPALLDVLVDAIEELRGAVEGGVDAVGVGVPSLVDFERGVSLASVHLPLADVAVRDLLAERLELPVIVDNDANCAVVGEHRLGAARGASDAVMLTLGTGIGGGLVLGGRLYRGGFGAAGEIGHMVVDADGPPCQGGCPNRGCLEALASGSAIGRAGEQAAREEPGSALGRALAGGREITGSLVTELGHDGDPAARRVIQEAGRWLGVGIASVVNVFNPEVVVVGGGVVAAGDLLLEPARAEMRARALAPSRDAVRIVPAHFGEESGVIGAAALALDG